MWLYTAALGGLNAELRTPFGRLHRYGRYADNRRWSDAKSLDYVLDLAHAFYLSDQAVGGDVMIEKTEADSVHFEVKRTNLAECRFVPAVVPGELESGELLVAVDRFAFTANNITYAVAGDMLAYWRFFPADEPWGRIPVWGLGDVVRSRHEAVREGERLYGYFPMSSWTLLRPGEATSARFIEVSDHRTALPLAYNEYRRTASDPLYDRAEEGRLALFRPLFVTAFLLDDLLAESEALGVEAILLTSASSKTAIALAALLSHSKRASVVGLTSARNAGFVASLGCYDRVVCYEEVRSIATNTPVAIVDLAGDSTLLEELHRHFGDGVKLSSLVGLTHYDRMFQPPKDLPGAPPAFFFAPDRLRKRSREWGGAVLQEQIAGSWRGFLKVSEKWFNLIHSHGPAEVERVYRATLEGRVPPHEGNVLSLRSSSL